MPNSGFLILALLFLCFAIYLTDYRAFREGRAYGRAEVEDEIERELRAEREFAA